MCCGKCLWKVFVYISSALLAVTWILFNMVDIWRSLDSRIGVGWTDAICAGSRIRHFHHGIWCSFRLRDVRNRHNWLVCSKA